MTKEEILQLWLTVHNKKPSMDLATCVTQFATELRAQVRRETILEAIKLVEITNAKGTMFNLFEAIEVLHRMAGEQT